MFKKGGKRMMSNNRCPINDQCENATLIVTTPFAAISMPCGDDFEDSDTESSDNESSDHFSGGSGDHHTVWYRLVSDRTGPLAVSTAHSDFDTKLCVFTGTCGNLTKVDCDNNSGACKTSLLFFNAVLGQTYFIKVSGASSHSCGTLYLTILGIQ
jgi:hypothetical protein